jgi:hypothetical protein
MLADNGQVKAVGIIPDYPDAGLSWISHTGFDHGTNGTAERTTVAFLGIGYQHAMWFHL